MVSHQFSRLQFKILLLSLFPAALMSLGLGAYVINVQLQMLDDSFQERGKAIAREMATVSVYGLFSGDLVAMEMGARSILNQPEVVAVTLQDTIGETLIHLGKESGIDRSLEYAAEHSKHLFSTPVLSGFSESEIGYYPDQNRKADATEGPLKLGAATVELLDTTILVSQKRIIRNSLLIVLLGLAITGSIAIGLGHRLTRPIVRLSQAVIRMKHGDFSARVPASSKGELLNLEDGFNSMAAELENSREEMQRQIERATSDLTQTMEALELQNMELALAKKKAIKVSQVKLEFLANMSHEIRTPMNGMIGFLNLLLKTELSPKQLGHVETISKSANNLLNIINNILDYSKLEYGRVLPESSPFSIIGCFEETVALLTPSAHEKGLELVLLIYSDVPDRLFGDEMRLRQIVINLVGNAIKFTHDGEVVLRVMLDEETEQDCKLLFSVTDTGIGIEKEVQKQLFDPFKQADQSTCRKYGGSGLGLSISRELILSMDGDISLESEHGVGSCFQVTVTLPKVPSKEATSTLQPFAEKRCLILDSHPLSRLSLAHHFTRLGLVVEQGDTTQHLTQESVTGLNLVVMGFSAGEMKSGEAENRISAYSREYKIPLLLLASGSKHPGMEHLEESFTVHFLSKPLTSKQLQGALQGLLGDRNLSAAVETSGPEPAKAMRSLANRSVLVVDDNDINLQLITALLCERGISVTRVMDGKQAVALAMLTHFDMILMDIHMPKLNGMEAAREIRSREIADEHIPIIALSADILPATRDKVLAAGMDDFLLKPINEDRLWELFDTLLGDCGSSDVPLVKREDRQSVPTRDLEQARRIAGGSVELAQAMFEQFCTELPDQVQTIRNQYSAREWERLHETIHRLHGATAVCGVPVLNDVVRQLEQAAINRDSHTIQGLLQRIGDDVSQLLSESEV